MKHFWWGIQDYSEIQRLQHKVWSLISEGGDEVILAGEHDPVITLGKRASENQILSEEIRVVRSTRGGLATLHSPGQLLIYPILDLRSRKMGVKEFVQGLLECTQMTLQDLDIVTKVDCEENPGIYTDFGKIAFCGLQIKNGISLHGISINVCNDISLFKHLVPCGQSNQKIDSIQKYRQIETKQFFEIWIQNYSKLLVLDEKSSQRGGNATTEKVRFCDLTLDLYQLGSEKVATEGLG